MARVEWPAEIDAGDGVVLRGADPIDAEGVAAAINESLGELRPWMAWAAQSTTVDAQAVRLALVGEAAAQGGDAGYTIFLDGAVAGVLGIHDRLGDPEAWELGYWLRTAATGRGVMTRAVRAAVAALASMGVERVEIHCDEANLPSAAVAERSGFLHVDTREAARDSPSATGRQMVWERRLSSPTID